LRRGEIKQLLWSDVHLDAPQPFIDVRAEPTKSKKAAVIPIIPVLAEAARARQGHLFLRPRLSARAAERQDADSRSENVRHPG
jgi:integrase